MANRPVFEAMMRSPFYREVNVGFDYYSGFSLSQKQKCIASLHNNYLMQFRDRKLLEVSSKSPTNLGVSLSAFNLGIDTKKRVFSVECAFQSSKVFQNGGPYIDLLDKSSIEAKKDVRLRNSGRLIAFRYFDKTFPLEPKDYFYNWLYINALFLNEELSHKILIYDSFTDIEFNPQKAINCQAKAAAIYVGLTKANRIEEAMISKEAFLKVVYESESKSYDSNQLFFDI